MDSLALLALLRDLQRQVNGVSKLAGPTGPAGPKGDIGPAGPAGADGRNGTDGRDGKDGRDGADGADGSDGEDGRGVVSVSMALDGDLVFQMTDGTEEIVSLPQSLTGPSEGTTYVVGQGRSSSYPIAEGRTAANLEGWTYVTELADLPAPVAGVITLEADHTYFFVGTVDLLGNRMVGGFNTCILGPSSENAFITSTGLATSTALFSTAWTTPIRHVTIRDVGTALAIDGTGNDPVAIDWTGVNFVNVPTIGTVHNIGNFIFTKGAFLNSQGLTFSGTSGTISFAESLLQGNGSAGAIVTVDSTAVVARRFRIIYSSVVAFGSTVGLDVSASATIPTQSYILDTCNFSGGSTYQTGVDFLDNKALFVNNVGIENSREVSQYYMNGNTVVTPIATGGDTQKIRGATTSGTYTSKFTNTDNRATYTGAIPKTFHVIATLSFSSGTNDLIGSYVAKNGSIIPESEMYVQTDTNGDFANATVQAFVLLSQNDYIEIFVENASDGSDITVSDLNVTVR